MESEEGGIVVAAATPTTLRRSSSQHSTVCGSLIASDVADDQHTTTIVNHNSNPTSRRPVSNLTIGAVLNGKNKNAPHPNNKIIRTLLKIVRNGDTLNTDGRSPSNRKKSWKSFKENLKCKKAQNRNSRRWTSSVRGPQIDVIPGSSSGRDLLANRNSLRNISIRRVDVVPADDVSYMEVDSGGSPRSDVSGLRNSEEENEEDVPYFDAPENHPVRISLMDLLEETDRQAGISGITYGLGDGEEEEDVKEDEMVEEVLGKGEFCCCVCMVRHKEAAFIPCGHAFCRLCSSKLFAQRGNCPLCNNFILEILHIF